ncbi:hypothetical protein SAMN05660964_00833 [Thiothrix caldifontis]|uniref:Uncharacterized protein n=1 Tax=Thiothrix caldifontis TaxID=525918 RepID=A0A1H3Y6K5_9GAMM|nr:hypothetical protein [Thiothrix caldifontis]SEA07180.1 hypothetical protein SAMN05660964_00833 [Thiothrix caldifontis]
MSLIIETVKYDNKSPLLFRQGGRTRRVGYVPQLQRGERVQRFQHRLERLFARQVY